MSDVKKKNRIALPKIILLFVVLVVSGFFVSQKANALIFCGTNSLHKACNGNPSFDSICDEDTFSGNQYCNDDQTCYQVNTDVGACSAADPGCAYYWRCSSAASPPTCGGQPIGSTQNCTSSASAANSCGKTNPGNSGTQTCQSDGSYGSCSAGAPSAPPDPAGLGSSCSVQSAPNNVGQRNTCYGNNVCNASGNGVQCNITSCPPPPDVVPPPICYSDGDCGNNSSNSCSATTYTCLNAGTPAATCSGPNTTNTPPTNGSLSGWSSCSSVCGTGSQNRTCSGAVCGGDATCGGASLSQSCSDFSSCGYSWQTGNYGTCTAGTQTRSVTCVRSDGTVVADSFCGGGQPSASQSCGACTNGTTQGCGSGTCAGIQTCSGGAWGSCNYSSSNNNSCNDNNACTSGDVCSNGSCVGSNNPTNSNWSAFSGWSTCNNGTQSRTRTCQGTASCGGSNNCSGPSTETQSCGNSCTPTNSNWSTWSAWSACSGGNQTRTRTCQGTASCGGNNNCSGSSTDTQSCTVPNCNSNSECNDGNACTQDICLNPGLPSAYCDNPVVGGNHYACSGSSCSATSNSSSACTDSCNLANPNTCSSPVCSFSFNRSSINFNATQNGPLPAGQNLVATNTGNQPITLYNDFVPQNSWLNSSPLSSGNGVVLNPGQSRTITFLVTGTNYSPQTFNGTTWSDGNCGAVSATQQLASISYNITAPATVTANLLVNGSHNPGKVNYYDQVTVSWTSANATSCTVTGNNGDSWNALASGGVQSSPLVNTTTYTLSCSGPGGTSATDQVTVPIPPPPTPVSSTCPAPGTSAVISWNNAPGYTHVAIRAVDSAAPWPPSSYVALINDYVGTSYNIPNTIPGHTYSWWIQTRDIPGSGAWSNGAGMGFTCQSPSSPVCPAASVSLSQANLNVGQSATAQAPSGWSGGTFNSSNSSIASISNPNNNPASVTGQSAGSANISGYNWTAPNGATACGLNATNITVSAAPKPVISLSPTSFTFNGISGGATPTGQALTISNTGNSALNWTAGGVPGKNATWCHASQNSGTITPGSSFVINVSVNSPSTAGTFSDCGIEISDPNAANNPQDVTVVYYVTAPGCPSGSVNLASSNLTPGQTTSASAPTGFSGGSFSSDNPSVASVSGTAVSANNLGSANISGNGWDFSGGATNCSLTAATVSVVSSPKPAISLSPDSFYFNAISGGATPAGQSLTIINTGNATLNWTASGVPGKNGTWCNLSPTSGSISPGNSSTATVSVNSPSYIGTFSDCGIEISDPNSINNPQDATVSYSVSAPLTHLVCVSNACTLIPGAGSNLDGCTAAGDSCISGPTHLECQSNACTVVAGGGSNLDGCMATGSSCVSGGGGSKPTIGLSPTSFTFEAAEGGATPVGQTVTISNSGTVALNWTSGGVPGKSGSWCHISPSSGSIAPGNNSSATVTVNSPSNVGSFTDCGIRISDPNATNNPQDLSITYNVVGKPGGVATTSLGAGPTCGDIQISWSAGGGPAPTAYAVYWNKTNNFYASGANPAARDISGQITTASFTDHSPGDQVSNYYWVVSYNASQMSAPSPSAVLSPSDSVAMQICGASLSNSDKDIIGVNNSTWNPNQCNGTDPIASASSLKVDNTVKFSVNICNTSGNYPAKSVRMVDTLTDLVQPPGGWDFQLDSGSGFSTILPSSISGTAPNQVITFNGLPDVPAGGIRTLTFWAQLAIPNNFLGTPRFQNSVKVDYTKDRLGNPDRDVFSTPLIPFYRKNTSPNIKEIP